MKKLAKSAPSRQEPGEGHLDNCTFNRPFDTQERVEVKFEAEAKLRCPCHCHCLSR